MKILKQGLIGLVFIALIFLVACQDKAIEEVDSGAQKTSVEIANIASESIIRFHQIPVVFLAKNRADLAFQLSGTIDKVMVKIGEEVEKGQALMSLYNPNIDSALASNLAALESIRAKILQVKRDVSNLKELRKNNSASKNALEHKETDLKDLLAQQKSINAQISLAVANQSESIIKAPFSGAIVTVGKQQGEFVAAGRVVMTLNQQGTLESEANITQLLWKSLKLGGKVRGEYQGNEVTFKVSELAQTADAQSHLMKVILQLDGRLENAIGQKTTLYFPQQYNNVYQLPLDTIVDDGINKPYVFTLVDGLAVKKQIQPLYINDGKIVFKTDSMIKYPVVIKGQSKISIGMSLQVKP